MLTALLVLENPWSLPRDDARSKSVLPFFEGLERVMGDELNLYYATFFERDSFERALQHVSNTRETRRVLYIAAHGDYGTLADGQAVATLRRIPQLERHIEGVIIGSCLIGNNDSAMRATLHHANENGANWVFSYRSIVEWMASTLIDMSIIEEVMSAAMLSRADILDTFMRALHKFNPDWEIATDQKGNAVTLRQSVRLWIRPQGSAEPQDVTDELLERLEWGE